MIHANRDEVTYLKASVELNFAKSQQPTIRLGGNKQMKEVKNVTVAGCGTIGSQIAYQTAFKNFNVTIYDIDDTAIKAGKQRLTNIAKRYRDDLDLSDYQTRMIYDNIHFQTSLEKAVKYADLVIEAIPEVKEIKSDFYKKIAEFASEQAIFTSNSSTMLPSELAQDTGRPEKFMMIHFSNEIWKNNSAEIMKHAHTSPQTFHTVEQFAEHIGMLPLPLYKEHPGYILNSLLNPLFGAAQRLLIDGIADVETIDKTWMAATGAEQGPFGSLDAIGLKTVYHVSKLIGDSGDESSKQIAEYIKKNYLEKGKLGAASGEGFYTYPDPVFKDTDFLL